jgi:hypothetical protein
MNKNILFFLAAAFLFAGVMSEKSIAADKPVAKGSFVQAWYCGSWSETRWQNELAAMKEAGLDYLIIASTVDCPASGTAGTYYPSTLPNTQPYESGQNMVELCLKSAEAAGIKVFLGISGADLWWGTHGADTTWLYNQMKFDNSVCDELWGLYKTKYPNAFYGWYWNYEADNYSFSTEETIDELIKAMNIQLDHLTAANIKLPFMWCPFMNSTKGTAAENKAMWTKVFSKLNLTAGDIFAPQDCVGAGGLDISEVVEWFTALREAVDTKPGLAFWSDVENFTSSGQPALLDRLTYQLEMEKNIVDDYITFAYCHYYSPYNTDPGFHATYLDYVKNGALETEAPSVPANFTAVLKNGDVQLDWDASTDNIGICGYIVYRNGVQISKTYRPVLNGSQLTPLPTGLSDGSLNYNTEYTYTVKAYDFANNISGAAPEIKIVTEAGNKFPINAAAGAAYTVSIAADASYPDKNNSELTNGAYARLKTLSDPAWEGVFDSYRQTRVIAIDLGSAKKVQQFAADFLYDPAHSIYLPASIKVIVSSDNVRLSDLGYFSLPNMPEGSPATAAYKCVKTIPEAVTARYVKFLITPGGDWTFLDELEARNNDTTSVGIEDGRDASAPYAYSLEQNYPNPFNPSTSIRYEISKAGSVDLKIYNVMGQLVQAVVDNEYREAGIYNMNVNMSGLASGIYLYKLTQNGIQLTKKMVLLK